MPYKDHNQKLEAMRRWRKRKMEEGYGRWLYQRRKLRFDDAERFRTAIERALEQLSVVPIESQATPASNAIAILTEALRESQEAEETIGHWQTGDHGQVGPWEGDDDGQEGS